MKVKTINKFRSIFGGNYQLWSCGEGFYLAEEFDDGVYHLYRSTAAGEKLSENLLGHNTDGRTEAKEFCVREEKARQENEAAKLVVAQPLHRRGGKAGPKKPRPSKERYRERKANQKILSKVGALVAQMVPEQDLAGAAVRAAFPPRPPKRRG